MDNRCTGITLMKMTKGLDKGPVLYAHEVVIKENETAGALFERLAKTAGDVIVRFLRNLPVKRYQEHLRMMPFLPMHPR
jgi:methionyl-tRNA formyltransferase